MLLQRLEAIVVRVAGLVALSLLTVFPVMAAENAPTTSRSQRWASGMLEVVSSAPGALVRVDGDVRGRTPMRVAGLRPGVHLVEVGPLDAPAWKKQVTIAQGSVVRLSVANTGSGSDVPTLVEGPGMGEAVKGWVRDNPVLLSLFRQPWAYASAAAFGLSLVGAGVLWTSTPSKFPVVGTLPMQVDGTQWKIAQWSVLGVAVVLGLSTVVLFLLPGLPLFKDALTTQDPAKAS